MIHPAKTCCLHKIQNCQASSKRDSDLFLHQIHLLNLEFPRIDHRKMAWRNQGITGSNNIPLGARRRFGGGDPSPPADDGGYNPSQPSAGLTDGGYKRGRSPEPRGKFSSGPLFRTSTHTPITEPTDLGEKRRKKRNRWGDAAENKAAGLMGLPTMIKANMTNEQLEAYTLHLRIQEISEKLRINDVVPADGDRCVSPPLHVIIPNIMDL